MDEEKREGLISRLLNTKDPTRDMKLAGFGAAIVATIVWLTREQLRAPITNQWVESLKWLLISVSLGGAGWTAVDKWKGTKNDSQS